MDTRLTRFSGRPSRALYTLLGASLLILPSLAEAQKARFGPGVLRDTTLANGLQVIAIRNPTAPTATAIVVFRAGAYTQANEQEEGIPHYIEHLIFKSYARSTSGTFAQHAGQLGAGYNGTTDTEAVQYFLYSLPAKSAANGVKLLADLVRSPRFHPDDMKTEVQVVRNELERRVSDQQFLLQFTVNQALWGTSWSRKNTGGNVFALLKATPQSLETLYKTYYAPENAAVIVSGDINLDEIVNTAAQAFKNWKGSGNLSPTRLQGAAAAAPASLMAPLTASKVVTAQGTASDITIQIAWHGPSAQADPTGAMSASIFTAFINNRNSPLQRQLVDPGLVQSVSANYRLMNHVGPITLTVRTTASRLVAAAAALQRELAKLADPNYFTDEDLPLAKKYWRVATAFEWERGAGLAHNVADHWAVAGLPSYIAFGDGIAARTTPEVREFIQKYLAGKPHVVGALISPDVRATLGRDFQTAMGALAK